MAKDKKSKRKKDEANEEMDKELLYELARAENEGFSMFQYSINNRKSTLYFFCDHLLLELRQDVENVGMLEHCCKGKNKLEKEKFIWLTKNMRR